MIVFTLRKTFSGWVLLAPKGHVVYELNPRTTTREAAYNEAMRWASSWSGVEVGFEDEQPTQRD